MVRKIGLAAFILLFVMQTLTLNMGMVPRASASQQSIFTNVVLTDQNGKRIDESTAVDKNSLVHVHIGWELNQHVTKETFSLTLPKELTISQEQSGVLNGEGGMNAGTYRATTNGTITATVDSQQQGKGIFMLKAGFNQGMVQDRDHMQLSISAGGKAYTSTIAFTDKIKAAEAEMPGEQEEQELPASEEETAEVEEDFSSEDGVEEGNEQGQDSNSADEMEEGNEPDAEDGTKEEHPDPEAGHDDEGMDSTEPDADNPSDVDQETEAGEGQEDSAEDVLEEETDQEPVEEEAEAIEDEEGLLDEFLEQNDPTIISEAIITSVLLKDEDGNEIHYEEHPGNQPSLGDIVELHFNWKLENGHGYKAGSTFTFYLPDVFEVYNEVDGELVFGSTNVGAFELGMDRKVTMTFNDKIEQLSNIIGTLTFWTGFREDLGGDIIQEIIFEVEDRVIAVIPIHFQGRPGSTLEKRGTPDKGYNAKEITWTIDVNKGLDSIEGAVLDDPIEDGQAFQPGSMEVYELNMQLDGSAVQGDQVAVGDGTFPLVFGDISTAYRVTFKTDVIDKNATSYKNKAILKGDNVSDREASAEVETRRGKPLEKRAAHYDAPNQVITWEIKFNYNEKSIPKDAAKLTDLFSASHELVDGSFNVYQVEINENGEEAGQTDFANYSVNPGKNGFELQFNEDISHAYKIIYQTRSKDRVYQGDTVKNKVEFGEQESSEVQPIRQQILEKSNRDADYKEKTTNWTIAFNKDSHEMNNVVLTDEFTNKGLSFIEDSLVITGPDGPLEKEQDYELERLPLDAGFTITFLSPISKPHTITYTTGFEYETRQDKTKNFINEALLTWTDVDGKDRELKAEAVFNPDRYTQNNGFKYGSYNAITKEITWNVGLNYNLSELENVVVTDYIQGNQQLLEDSITVYHMELTGGADGVRLGEPLQPNTDYSLRMIEGDDGEPGFEISFPGTITTPYWITYKTSLAEQLIKDRYHNSATVQSENDDTLELHASLSINHGGEFTGKTGTQHGKVIDWQVKINYSQSHISNAVLTDRPSSNQILMRDSFKLYATNVDEEGNLSKGEQLNFGEDYLLEFLEDENVEYFKLHFKRDLDRAYLLEYQSYISAKHEDSVTNTAVLSGEHITIEETESNETIIVRFTDGSGTGSGVTGSLEVTKVAAETDKPLAGARFTLYDSSGTIAIRTLETGADGKVKFENLLYDEYLLKEAKAPEGYVVGITDTLLVAIDGDNAVKVENRKLKRAVQLEKLDQDTRETLEGAVFELQQKQGNEFVTLEQLTTDEDGVLLRHDLEPGEYQFVEAIPPFGYELDQTPIPFTITHNQVELIKLQMENTIVLGAVELVKADKDEPTLVLEGVEFELQDSQGTTLQTGLTTDQDGRLIVGDLRPGTYQFVETKAAEHYMLPDKPFGFTIVKGQEERLIVSIENQLIPGAVELTKVDRRNHGNVLAGAEFELQNRHGVTLQAGLTTDENGKLVVDELRPGSYQFIETKAPAGYRLDQTPHPFTIEVDQKESVKLLVENQRRSSGGGGGGPRPPEDPDEVEDEEPEEPGEHDGEEPGDHDEEEPSGNDGEEPGDHGDGDDPGHPEEPGDNGGDDRPEPGPGSGDNPGDGGKEDDEEHPNGGGAGEGKTPNDREPALEKETNSGQQLPQTGEEKLLYMLILGVISLMLGGGILLHRRFKTIE
ncbi:SpaA isopeptide-forming pilin-related protein [Alkalihalobacillus oceani]|uniref:SpaA isopeptide-forming pilin-related protein n=1 Tax=Halalkalibacter oceani TaxID=1653776 RepID=A0A9X2IPV3_9BACI|nr:collagen binding domain-containing protein [Halalkalibacter oceani]MCM3715640.1 SpaA isopeptide-forming pilin-related protein [Halalkalibacter oceani]